MGKNVAVFVDVANIFYAAKAAGTDIDYVTLLLEKPSLTLDAAQILQHPRTRLRQR